MTLEQVIAHRRTSGQIFDFRSSGAFREARLDGSEWRNIGEILSGDPSAGRPVAPVMLIANDRADGCETAALLAQHGWRIAGLFVWDITGTGTADIGPGSLPDAIDERALFAGRHHGNMQDSRDYLAWEEELPGQIDPLILDVWNRLLTS